MKRMLACLALFFPAFASASECFAPAAARYRVNEDLLWAIAMVESSMNPNAVGVTLKDGNVALGYMGINTIHLEEVAPYGITRADLFKPCVNIPLGAWRLAICIGQFGGNWRALGCYWAGPHSKNFEGMRLYAAKVEKAYFARLAQKARAGSAPLLAAVSPSYKPSRKMAVWSNDE